ncbi:hypothetical protein [Paracoccus actinidiae]|uniref:hypothetical protein n=1 Tax=Paracoccus actinidiae TaxID=3064531 RepID=UPI0027D2B5C6|nr:hypothetical protein [Paracoccus sp. M09]
MLNTDAQITDLDLNAYVDGQLTAENPRALPAAAEREKVDDFYAARSSSMPPLPWTSFSPPFSHLRFLPVRPSACVRPTSPARSASFRRHDEWAFGSLLAARDLGAAKMI